MENPSEKENILDLVIFSTVALFIYVIFETFYK